MKDFEQKIIKIGNSLGITIPAELLVQVGFKQGDDVRLQVEDGELYITKSQKHVLPEDLSEDFFDVLDETIADYDKTIRGLADR